MNYLEAIYKQENRGNWLDNLFSRKYFCGFISKAPSRKAMLCPTYQWLKYQCLSAYLLCLCQVLANASAKWRFNFGIFFPWKKTEDPLSPKLNVNETSYTGTNTCRTDLLIGCWDTEMRYKVFLFMWVSKPYPSLCLWSSLSFTAPSLRTCYGQDCFGLCWLLFPSSSSEHYCWEMGISQKETSFPCISTPHRTVLATIIEVKYEIKQNWNVWGQS